MVMEIWKGLENSGNSKVKGYGSLQDISSFCSKRKAGLNLPLSAPIYEFFVGKDK